MSARCAVIPKDEDHTSERLAHLRYNPTDLAGVINMGNLISDPEHVLVLFSHHTAHCPLWVVLAVMKLHFNFLDSSFDKLRQFS